jgi:hypothetical protein
MKLKNFKITVEIEEIVCDNETAKELNALNEKIVGITENFKKSSTFTDPIAFAHKIYKSLDREKREEVIKQTLDIIKGGASEESETKNKPKLYIFKGPAGSGQDTLVNEILSELGSPKAIDLRNIDETSSYKFSKCEKETQLIVLKEYKILKDDDGNPNLSITVDKKGVGPFQINPSMIIVSDDYMKYCDITDDIYDFPTDDIRRAILKKNVLNNIK